MLQFLTAVIRMLPLRSDRMSGPESRCAVQLRSCRWAMCTVLLLQTSDAVPLGRRGTSGILQSLHSPARRFQRRWENREQMLPQMQGGGGHRHPPCGGHQAVQRRLKQRNRHHCSTNRRMEHLSRVTTQLCKGSGGRSSNSNSNNSSRSHRGSSSHIPALNSWRLSCAACLISSCREDSSSCRGISHRSLPASGLMSAVGVGIQFRLASGSGHCLNSAWRAGDMNMSDNTRRSISHSSSSHRCSSYQCSHRRRRGSPTCRPCRRSNPRLQAGG